MSFDSTQSGVYSYWPMLTKTHIQTLSRMPGATNRLSKAIELGGITQTAIAQDLGLTQPYVSNVIQERYCTISLQNAYKFSNYFGCPLEAIFPPTCRHATGSKVRG